MISSRKCHQIGHEFDKRCDSMGDLFFLSHLVAPLLATKEQSIFNGGFVSFKLKFSGIVDYPESIALDPTKMCREVMMS